MSVDMEEKMSKKLSADPWALHHSEREMKRYRKGQQEERKTALAAVAQ